MATPASLHHHRSPKRQRLSSVDEDEEDESEGYISPNVVDHNSPNVVDYSSPSDVEGEEEEDDDEVEEEEEDEEEEEEEDEEVGISEDVGGTRMATIGNDSEDVITEAQSRKPISSSPSSSSPSSSQSVKLKTSDILDCPTCCEPLKKPIYQCTNGHLACSSCCTKLKKKCPFCRSDIGDIRCRAMEIVIEASIVPCRNAIYGCKETTSYGNQSSHEKLCVSVCCSCPLLDCTFTGSYTDLQSHVRADHTYTKPSDKDSLIPFVFDNTLVFVLYLDKKKAVFQEKIEGDLVVVQAFKRSHGLYVTASCIAPNAPEVRSLSCSLTKLGVDGSVRHGLKVKKIQKVREPEQPEDGFMLIPPYMFDGCNYLTLRICIGSGSKYLI